MYNIKALVSQALELDARGESGQAYRKYQESLSALLPLLQQPAPGVPRSALLNHFKLAQNCFERMAEIVMQLGEEENDRHKEDHFDGEDEGDYLQFASLPASRRDGEHPEGPNLRRLSLSQHDRQESIHRSNTLPTRNNSPNKMEPQKNKNKNKNDAFVSLSALRRHHECTLVAQQKAKSERILRAHAGALSQNEQYVTNLLNRRRQLQNRVNERILDIFQGISSKALDIRNSFEMEKKRKSIKLALEDLDRSGKDFAILQPLLEVFRSKSDPVGILLREHIRQCRANLLEAASNEGLADINSSVERVLDEIGMVEYHLVEVFQNQYEELGDPSWALSIKVTLQDFIFSTALGPLIFSQIHRILAKEDSSIAYLFCNASWEDLFTRLRVKPRMQLGREGALDAFPISDAGIYTRAIEELRGITSVYSPLAKLLCLTRSCNALCQSVEEYQRSDTFLDSSRLEDSLGSDDLLLLSSYVLVRAQIADLPSQLMFLSKLVPEELIRGEAGYVLATYQTALEYASHCLS